MSRENTNAREVAGVKLLSVRFVKSAVKMSDLPELRLPQIAFLGRSNVGKSSLLNTLLGDRKLVKVSSTPGKTQELNFFAVNEAFYVVDLPGVGYTRVSYKKQEQMTQSIRQYIEKCEDLRGVVYLVDIRHEGTPIDVETVAGIRAAGRPVLIVASKRDKVNQFECAKSLQAIKEKFGLDYLPITVSSLKKTGIAELWSEILTAVSEENIENVAGGGNA